MSVPGLDRLALINAPIPTLTCSFPKSVDLLLIVGIVFAADVSQSRC